MSSKRYPPGSVTTPGAPTQVHCSTEETLNKQLPLDLTRRPWLDNREQLPRPRFAQAVSLSTAVVAVRRGISTTTQPQTLGIRPRAIALPIWDSEASQVAAA